jgi:hypothetical protein
MHGGIALIINVLVTPLHISISSRAPVSSSLLPFHRALLLGNQHGAVAIAMVVSERDLGLVYPLPVVCYRNYLCFPFIKPLLLDVFKSFVIGVISWYIISSGTRCTTCTYTTCNTDVQQRQVHTQ